MKEYRDYKLFTKGRLTNKLLDFNRRGMIVQTLGGNSRRITVIFECLQTRENSRLAGL